jgi:hypothetical protein
MKKNIKKVLMSGWWWVVGGWLSLARSASGSVGVIANPYTGAKGVCDAADYVNVIIAFLTAAACVFFLITIILSGINIITKVRSPDDFAANMKKIGLGAVGLVVIALSYVIAAWLGKWLFGSADMLTNPLKVLNGC